MASNDYSSDESYYYTQYMIITKEDNNLYQFCMYGNWNESEYFIKGSCIRVNNNLILNGASQHNTDTYQVSMLSFPETEEELIKGLLTLSRIEMTASLSSRIIFKKVINSSHLNGATCIQDIFSKISKDSAKRVPENKLLSDSDIKKALDGKKALTEMKQYVDNSRDIIGVLHS
jgi:hypothetical protein